MNGLLLLVLLAAASAFPAAAAASFPGENGAFVVSLNKCSSYSAYLARVPSRGGAVTPFTPTCDENPEEPTSNYRAPVASPDGGRLLAIRLASDSSGFVTMTPEGGDEQVMPLPSDFAGGLGGRGPSFAPNGNAFVFDEGGERRLWRGRLDTGSVRVLRDEIRCGRQYVQLTDPSWSPDGKLIAVKVGVPARCKRRAKLARSGLWLIRARDGRFVRRVAGYHARTPDWSPDGKQLVYGTDYHQREVEGGAAGGNLYVVSRDGRRVRKLVHRHDIAETHPTWSPDGRWIAWVSLEFGAGDVGFDAKASLWRVRPSGRGRQRLTSLPDPYVEEGDFHRPALTWLPR
jgi:Tol biopolymer transport system component